MSTESEETSEAAWVMVRQSLDGSYVAVILDFAKMVVTHSMSVNTVQDESSVDGFQFETSCLHYNKNLEVYFGMMREHYLRNLGYFVDW